MKKTLTYIFLSLLIISLKAQQRQFSIIKSGYLSCFDTVIYDVKSKKPFTCEPSTVLNFKNNLIIGNDKIFPENYSSIFTIPYENDTIDCKKREYNTYKLFKSVHKFESSTILPDSSFVIFCGAFDYHETDPKEGNFHNTAIFFDPQNPEIGGILHTENFTDKQNSFGIKKFLRQSLIDDDFPQGPPYLKVEATAVVPGNKILFGIREYGKSYKDFKYTITIIETSYKIKDRQIFLNNDFKKIYSFNPDYGVDLGISAMEYNPADSCLYIVTSYELGSATFNVGSYLWYIKLNDLYAGKDLQSLSNRPNEHRSLAHKIEGLTFLSSNKILLLCDDDRITGIMEKNPLFSRKLNEAFWYVIEVK